MFGTQVTFSIIACLKTFGLQPSDFVLNRKRNLSTNYLPVGAFHLRGGFNTIERSETFPSTSGSLSAVCRSLYRLSSRYVGF